MSPFALTKHKTELQFTTNHLSHFLLTLLLVPKLKMATSGARVVCVASEGAMLATSGTSRTAIDKLYQDSTYDSGVACK